MKRLFITLEKATNTIRNKLSNGISVRSSLTGFTKLFLVLFIFFINGCTTISTEKRLVISTFEEKIELARSLSNEKIYELISNLSRYLNTEEDRIILRQELISRYPEWTTKMRALVEEGKINIGMIEEQVLASWGRPKKINKDVGTWGVFEQWVYEAPSPSYGVTYYVYLENGVVVTWQKYE